jgi:hypothetical protein
MTTAMRAGIMLTVLVGLPAAWVYYGPLPPHAQQVVDRVVAAAKEAVEWDELTARREPERIPQHRASAAATATSPAPALVAASSAPSPEAPALIADTAAPRSLVDRVAPLRAQLHEWGVAEYRLDLWGARQELYRFSCEMPLAPGSPATEQFEAVAADPQAAVEQVVAEVRRWKDSQLTAMR